MLAKYEAPGLTMYGTIGALTNSAKCTPGSDTTFAAGDAVVHVTQNLQTYNDGAPMQFINGGLVPAGTDCINMFDLSTFTTG